MTISTVLTLSSRKEEERSMVLQRVEADLKEAVQGPKVPVDVTDATMKGCPVGCGLTGRDGDEERRKERVGWEWGQDAYG
jgi:hypothetical protein